MAKKYVANVAVDMIDYFEEALKQRSDKIHSVTWSGLRCSAEGDTFYKTCIIEADEGVIDPIHELKD